MDRIRRPSMLPPPWVAALLFLGLACATQLARAQAPYNGQAGVTNGLYGRPTAQPFFDFPNWARFSNCRPGPLPWGYEVFPGYEACDGACNCVDSVGCYRDFVVHRPSDWYASADFAPLTVDYGSDVSVAQVFTPAVPAVPGVDNSMPADGDFTDPGDVLPVAAIPAAVGPSVLSTGDFRPEFNAGGKYTVGRRVFDCYRIEATYLGWYEWESSAIATDPDGDLFSILGGFDLPPDPVFDNNTEIFIAQQARLWSAEANLRYWIDMPPGPFDVSCLVGARYMSIDDRFRLHSTNAGGENDVLSETENKMIGVQIGVAGDFMIHPRYWINVDLKGGMYNNEITLNYNLDSFDDAQDQVFPGFRQRTTWVGELSIVGHWQVTPNLVFNLGYQAIGVDGLALGFENVANQPFLDGINPPPTTQFDDSGHLVYHGPIIGLLWQR
jgi:hypothetical protein